MRPPRSYPTRRDVHEQAREILAWPDCDVRRLAELTGDLMAREHLSRGAASLKAYLTIRRARKAVAT
jgi:hypothetical protein